MKTRNQKISLAKRLFRYFEIDITIKMFGVIVWRWRFPPKSDDDGSNDVANNNNIDSDNDSSL